MKEDRLERPNRERWERPDGDPLPVGISLAAGERQRRCERVIDGARCVRVAGHARMGARHVFAAASSLAQLDAVDRATIDSVHRKRARHAARTRAGMAAAAAGGATFGRPRAKLNVENARVIFAARARGAGREEAWRFTAKLMHVSVSTLKRALAKGRGR